MVSEKKVIGLTLIREKSMVIQKFVEGQDNEVAETIRSNRCVFMLGHEHIVIRAKYIHLTLYMAALIAKDHKKNGPFLLRPRETDWRSLWFSVHSNFDREYDQVGWVQIYINGSSVYSTHQFSYLDVIERCAVDGEVQSYDESLGLTERLLAESGQHVEINHTSTIAVSIKEKEDCLYCGLIHRRRYHDNIFSFNIMNKPNKPTLWLANEMAGAFIEMIDLTFRMGDVKKKVKVAKSTVSPAEINFARACRERRADLEKKIDSYEATHDIRYRPERPQFSSDEDYSF